MFYFALHGIFFGIFDEKCHIFCYSNSISFAYVPNGSSKEDFQIIMKNNEENLFFRVI